MRSALPLFMLLLFAAQLPAQSAKAFEKAGDKALAENDFYAAVYQYREAMERSPDDVGLWYKYAEVARQFNAFEEAEKYYEKVLASNVSERHPMAPFWLGQVKKCLGKYEAASEYFEAFLKKNTSPSYYTDWAINELNTCKWAMADLPSASGKSVQIAHLDKKINTPFSEFGAVQVGDLTYYSSFRFDFPKDDNKPARKLSKVLSSDKLGKGKLLPNEFNDEKKLTAHTAISPDGQRLYFTLCEYMNASSIRCEIAYRDKDKKGRWEKQATLLPATINLKGFTATQPTIGFDSLAKKTLLYFVSDRPGGKGKLDIWYSELKKEGFSEPINLEAFNTPENDISPFFHVAAQRLFFSSDGRSGLGGYDVFEAERLAVGDSAVWSEARNLGKPVNSSYHDIYYSLDADGKGGYLSSNRPGSFYLDPENKACCHDIYRITYQDLPTSPVQGIPPPKIAIVPKLSPPIFEKLEDFLPLALYFDNDEPDKRTNRTTTKKSYEETFQRFYPRKKTFIEQYTKPIADETEMDEATLNITDFFETEVKKGFDHLGLFCEILQKRLENSDRVEIVIKGYTSPRAKTDYNEFLAQRRISSLRNHFLTWRNGVLETYLKTGKLVISEAPFGESQAATNISDDLFDERNSVYSVGASKERRVEIIEVK
jgi:tetratricopeptide (TPR) repeat protein